MVIILFILACIAMVTLFLYVRNQAEVHSRLVRSIDDDVAEPPISSDSPVDPLSGILSGWLYRAGFRQPLATVIFVTATLGCGLVSFLIVFAVFRVGLIARATDALYSIPGGVGNVMVPFALAAPWLLVVIVTLIPMLVVRSFRRRRVKSIEQDLPLMLDLLNTLSQAGIGFDSALERILAAQSASRPLVQDMRSFQRDTLAGRSRLDSLRRCMRRVEVPMFSAFIAALIQAEQTGAGMSATLRIQAAEMRSRRRERASAIAMAVPTKLVLPMIVGFLPGIFVILLGPMITQAFSVLNQQLRTVTGQ